MIDALWFAANAAAWVADQRLVTRGDGLEVTWQAWDGGNGIYVSYAPAVEGCSFVTQKLAAASAPDPATVSAVRCAGSGALGTTGSQHGSTTPAVGPGGLVPLLAHPAGATHPSSKPGEGADTPPAPGHSNTPSETPTVPVPA